MKKIIFIFLFLPVCLFSQGVPETILDLKLMNTLINETSGSLQLKNLYDMGSYEADRKNIEFTDLFRETKYVFEKAKDYGFSDVKIERWKSDEKLWNGQVGELWMIEPEKKLLISFRDETMALVPNSISGEYEAEMVFVGKGTSPDDYKNIDVKGKIVVGESSIYELYRNAVQKNKAKGVISYNVHHFFENPDKIASQSLPNFSDKQLPDSLKHYYAFGFCLSPRIGKELVDAYYRLRDSKNYGGGDKKIVLKAIVRSDYKEFDEQLVNAIIPGDGTTDEEICLSAHLSEGYYKQGANDDFSGCVTMLEVGRSLNKMIKEGLISKPKRTIRFLWVPEISGSFWFLANHEDIAKKTKMNINLDMVGEDTHKNLNTLVFYENLHSRAHWSDDATVDILEWINKTSSERLETRGFSYGYQIFDMLGSRHPFYYNVEPWSSGSDHMIFQMQYFKIPSVFFNNWPDVNYHTSFDRPAYADATELRRIGVITSALTLLGSVTNEVSFYRVANIVFSKVSQRLGAGLSKELRELDAASPEKLSARYRDSRYIIQANYERERARIESLMMFATNTEQNNKFNSYINIFLNTLKENEKSQLTALKSSYAFIAKIKNIKAEDPEISSAEKEMATLIPEDNELKKGELAAKSIWEVFGNRQVQIKGLSQKFIPELRNFVDGKRDLLMIRNLVSAEFEPVPIEETLQLFKQLEKNKSLKLKKK